MPLPRDDEISWENLRNVPKGKAELQFFTEFLSFHGHIFSGVLTLPSAEALRLIPAFNQKKEFLFFFFVLPFEEGFIASVNRGPTMDQENE